MAQLIFEALTGNVTSIDGQATLSVQSLVDGQNVSDTIAVDEDDLFLCGKCKKEFTNLVSFLNHKQGQCLGDMTAAVNSQVLSLKSSVDVCNSNGSIVYTTHLGPALTKQLNTYNGVPVSSVVPAGLVLGDEIISFHTVDPTSCVSLGPMIPGASYLDQMTTKNPNSAIYSTIGDSTNYVASMGDFTGVIDGSQLQFQRIAAPSDPQMELSQVIISVPQSDPVVEALFSAQAVDNPSNCLLDQGSHDETLISTIDGGSTLPEYNSIHSPRNSRNSNSNASDDSGKKKLKCQYCDKTFLKNFDLQQHVRSHTGEKPFQCVVCGRAFAQKSNVKKHMQTHKVWPQGLSNTLPAQLVVAQGDSLDPIVVNAEPTTVTAATDSGTVFTPMSNVPAHSLMANPVPCEAQVDGSNLQSSDNYESSSVQQYVKQWPTIVSVRQETSSDGEKVNVVIDNSYICQYCGNKFSSYFLLKSHMVIHKNEQVYKCILKTCGECFRELDEFLEHTKIHENEITYRCYVCNKTFGSLYELGTHQYSHSLYPNQGPKPGAKYFRCVKCNNKYASPEALQHHLETTSHSFPCPYCPKIFACERYLRRHLPTHGTVGEYECDICNKQFKTEHYLKMHLVIHSNEKPFHCDKCSTSFNRRDKLKRHMLIHETVKKYKCPFRSLGGCMKEFNRADKLKSHIISHSGIKPFKCKTCNKLFTRRPHLREHEQTHTNCFQYTCARCGKGFRRQRLLRDHICDLAGKASLLGSLTDAREAAVRSSVETRATVLPKKKYISNRVTVPRRGRPPKQQISSSAAVKSTSQRSSRNSRNARTDHSKSAAQVSPETTVLDPQVTDIVTDNLTSFQCDEPDSLAVTNMIAIEQPLGGNNLIALDQTLSNGNGTLHGSFDGNVITLEQSPDGTLYLLQPFMGKVEELSSPRFTDSESNCIESVRRSFIDHVTALKSNGLISSGQTAIVVSGSPNDCVPKVELTDPLCQVIFTETGTG